MRATGTLTGIEWRERRLIEVDQINAALTEYCNELGHDSCNYTVTAKLYLSVGPRSRGAHEVVTDVFGPDAKIDECESSLDAVVASLREGFQFRGDAGAHPSLAFLNSSRANAMLRSMEAALEQLFVPYVRISSVEFESGHPFYPVFWDYAYVIQRTNEAYILVASSSD